MLATFFVYVAHFVFLYKIQNAVILDKRFSENEVSRPITEILYCLFLYLRNGLSCLASRCNELIPSSILKLI